MSQQSNKRIVVPLITKLLMKHAFIIFLLTVENDKVRNKNWQCNTENFAWQ